MAIRVVSGSAAIRPIDPTRVPMICTLTASRLIASTNGVSPTLKKAKDPQPEIQRALAERG